MKKCLVRDLDGDGVMFFCELQLGHEGRHHRERKSGYRRAYVVADGERTTFAGLRSR